MLLPDKNFLFCDAFEDKPKNKFPIIKQFAGFCVIYSPMVMFGLKMQVIF